MSVDILKVFWIGDHGIRTPEEPFLLLEKCAADNIAEMNQKSRTQNYRAELMKEQNRAESADCMSESRSPAGMAEAKNHSGQSQPKKSRHDGGVQIALARGEAPVVLSS